MSLISLCVLVLFLQDLKNDPKGTIENVLLFGLFLVAFNVIGGWFFN